MRKTVSIWLFVILIIVTYLPPKIAAETAESPTWRPDDTWQYNMTIEGNPYYQTHTIKFSGWGSFYIEGKEYDSIHAYYMETILENSDDYGQVGTKIQENRGLTRWPDYKMGLSWETIYKLYEKNLENRTIKKITSYSPLIDLYQFPINVGDKWSQTSTLNVNYSVYRGAGIDAIKEENKIKDGTYSEKKSFYFHCTGVEEINVSLIDDWDEYRKAGANWTEYTYTTLRIVQDDEEIDTDGTYSVEYYNSTVGNYVKKETFTNGMLNRTQMLVYYEYETTDEPWEEPENFNDDEGSQFCLCIGAIAILVVLILIFAIIRRRQLEEDRFTKEYIEGIEAKTELVELCEEAHLSTKGSKMELRKRLLTYAEEIEKEKAEKELEEVEEEEEEDEFEIGEEEVGEEDMDEEELEEGSLEEMKEEEDEFEIKEAGVEKKEGNKK